MELKGGIIINYILWMKNCLMTFLLKSESGPGVDSSLETLMTCMGHYEVRAPIYGEFIMKNKCICTNGMLGNELIYSY